MSHRTRAGIGLIRLGDSDLVPANPEDDVRSKAVYDAEGQRIGGVEDLYIDRKEREVRFLVPVEAVMQVTQDPVTIEPERTQKVEGPAPSTPRSCPSAPTSRPTPTPGCLTATLRAPPTSATPRYGTSTGRTSGRRAGGYGPYCS